MNILHTQGLMWELLQRKDLENWGGHYPPTPSPHPLPPSLIKIYAIWGYPEVELEIIA